MLLQAVQADVSKQAADVLEQTQEAQGKLESLQKAYDQGVQEQQTLRKSLQLLEKSSEDAHERVRQQQR